MKRSVIWSICVGAVLLFMSVLVVAQEHSSLADLNERSARDSVFMPPGGDDDESCDEPGDHDDDESSDEAPACSIATAVANLDAVPTLTLEGSFCDEPTVSLGTAGGQLVELFVNSSGPTFVAADLAPWTDSGTRLVVVDCPCGSCAMDVTIGTVGPAGPQGPQGDEGPPGALPSGITVPPRLAVRWVNTLELGEEITCAAAECLDGEMVTGGGHSTWSYNPYTPELQTGFELASEGPYLPWDLFEPDYGLPGMPSSTQWVVCGSGPGLRLTVYAICLSTTMPICGDGEVSAPETCESDDHCSNWGPFAECANCNCIHYCGDGVVDPGESCESDEQCYGGYCENCQCVPEYPCEGCPD